MRAALAVLFAVECFGQTIALRERVLILVNDRMKESVEVGRYYAERRQIPQTNILRLKTNTGETMSFEEYKDQIENPLRNLPLSIVAGTAAVIAIYVLVNVIYLRAMGVEGLAATTTPAGTVNYIGVKLDKQLIVHGTTTSVELTDGVDLRNGSS